MKNKAIILGTITVSLLSLSSFASASFDCSSIDKDEIKTLMDKQKAWTTLTDDETTLLKNAESCRPTGSWSWMTMRGWKSWFWWEMMSWSWMTEEQKSKMEEIKTILEKQKTWETLTDEEQATLDEFNANRTWKSESWSLVWSWKTIVEKINKRASTTKVSDSYKSKIDKKVKSMISSSTSDEEKIEILETFLEKITTIQESINNSSYSDSKKQTYVSLINYFIESINSSISDLKSWSDSSVDSLINEVFWE